MNTLVINEETSPTEFNVVEQTAEFNQVVQTLQITQSDSDLNIAEVTQHLDLVSPATNTLELTSQTSLLEVIPNSIIINQYFSGEGAVADQDTILGDGTQFDPLRAPDMLKISLRLGEFSTAAAKQEAVTNLGLHVIDGGTFTY